MDLEKQFKRDIRCLGELAWNCLLSDRHSFFEEELEELERKSEKLVARRLGFVYKEESLKVLKPQHEYCFLHKSFQEYLAASYIAHKLQRNKFNVFEHLNFDAVVKKFLQVFLFLCGILRKDASILFEQIGEKLKSDWNWYACSDAAANFFIESWSESGNAEEMANTLCLLLPFPRAVGLFFFDDSDCGHWNLLRVLVFCRRFSKVKVPDEIHLEINFSHGLFSSSVTVRDLASLPNLKSLDFSECDVDVESVHELFQILPDFASLTELVLREVPEMTDWGIAAKALTTSKTLEKVECILLGERGEGWFRAFDAGLCADTALSSVDLTIRGPMRETALQALENLLLNKSLSSLSLTVDGDMSYSLAVTLSRALAGQTALKVLELRVNGKLSFCCANLIEREGEESTGKENIAATINVQRRDPSCDDSDDFLGRRLYDTLLLDLPRNCSLNSLTLTINNFNSNDDQLSFTLISFLESCISLKSLNLTLNEYNDWEDTYASLLCQGLGSNTSLISVTLTLNVYTRASNDSYFDFDGISDDDFVPNISMDSFTLTINDFIRRGDWFEDDIIDSDWGLKLAGLWPSYKSLNTFNLTLNNRDKVSVSSFLEFFDAVMKVNSLRTLRVKVNYSLLTEDDFSQLVVKSPSLELIELTICHDGVACGWLETLKWEKQ
ncbi:uncharacterized protein LOC141864552 isoform X2 [Acropora palmata]|uniref:uncharacterized protein LOC141864552 isoform X2 n=1 Tax=Acropora palmata TaxID=6131 RepID=UPI003DA02EF2